MTTEMLTDILDCWGVRIEDVDGRKKLIGPGGKHLKATWHLAAVDTIREDQKLSDKDAQIVVASMVLYEVARALIAEEQA